MEKNMGHADWKERQLEERLELYRKNIAVLSKEIVELRKDLTKLATAMVQLAGDRNEK